MWFTVAVLSLAALVGLQFMNITAHHCVGVDAPVHFTDYYLVRVRLFRSYYRAPITNNYKRLVGKVPVCKKPAMCAIVGLTFSNGWISSGGGQVNSIRLRHIERLTSLDSTELSGQEKKQLLNDYFLAGSGEGGRAVQACYYLLMVYGPNGHSSGAHSGAGLPNLEEARTEAEQWFLRCNGGPHTEEAMIEWMDKV